MPRGVVQVDQIVRSPSGKPDYRWARATAIDGLRAVNRLGEESSPYLRQHADNPVDWYPWGDEATAAARELDRPIFLSVGYSACHWCHVMAHESFEDPDVAALMNRLVREREGRPRGAARRRRRLHAGGAGADRAAAAGR